MINTIIKFFQIEKDNSELKEFFESLIECWISGTNSMYWDIKDKKNIDIIKNFFAELYKGHENFYSIKKWNMTDDFNEYEIKWFFSLEEVNENNNSR